jgi:hypothetical protein
MADKDDIATVLNSVTFLRMAVSEMRRIANDGTDPETAARLRHMADQCEAEIRDLETRFKLPRLLQSN